MASAYPSAADYTSLEEHQSQTPATFFGGKPVLYAHLSDCRVLAEDLTALADFGLLSTSVADTNGISNGDVEEPSAPLCHAVDVFVNSHDVTLANRTSSQEASLLRIPYRAISIHATQRLYPAASSSAPLHYTHAAPTTDATPVHAILLYLDPAYETREQQEYDEDAQDVAVTIIPPHSSGQANEEAAQALFEALSKCADLYPDPEAGDESRDAALIGGGMPGEGGWITADSAQDVGGESLGGGAGARRGHDMLDDEGNNDDDGSKWQRTG